MPSELDDIRCPGCGEAMTFVEGRSEWWCNRCLAFAAGEGPPDADDDFAAPSPAAVGPSNRPSPSGAGVRALEVADTTTSLIIVVPILLVTAAACTVLSVMGLGMAATIVGVAGVALAYLAW